MRQAENKLLSFIEKHILWFAGAVLLFFSFYARKNVLYYLSGDMKAYLISWYYQILDHHGFPSLAFRIGNYNIPYHFLMCIVALFKGEAVYLIKYLSIFFDYVLAVAGALLVREAVPAHRKDRNLLTFAAFFIVLALPTVFLNSAVWGQCDAIFTSFLIFSIWAFLKDKPSLGMIFYGLSLCFKLQAILLLPAVLLYYFCSRKLSLLHFLWIPVMMAVTSLPGVYYGRSIFDFLDIYKEQAEMYPYLTMDYPNIYYFVPNDYRLFSTSGILLTLAVLLIGYTAVIWLGQKKPYEFQDYFRFAIWTAFTCIMFLPSMHDRYGFPMEIMLVLYCIIFREYFFEAAASIAVAILAYVPFLLDFTPIPLTYVAAGNIVLYLILSWRIWKSTAEPRLKTAKK